MDDSHSRLPPEETALLSRKIFNSPEILHICPIQIRGPLYSDVALVGEHHVEMKEIDNLSGRFHHVAFWDAFGARIRCAGVYGTAVLTEDQGPRRQDLTSDQSRELDRVQAESTKPTQSLLLVLESRRIVFLAMRWSTQQRLFNFTQTTVDIPLHPPVDQVAPSHDGRAIELITVDPWSRAIATASRTGEVCFYYCQSHSTQDSLGSDTVRCCHLLRAHFHVSKMDFLYPPAGCDDYTYLILVGTDGHRPRWQIFYWLSGSANAPRNMDVVPPPEFTAGHGIPQMLIPLMGKMHAGGFLMACENLVAIYDDVAAGQPHQVYAKDPDDWVDGAPTQIHAGISRSRPLWKAWCRPNRRVNSQPNEERLLYVAREDGCLGLMLYKDIVYAAKYVGDLHSLVQSAFNHDGRDLTSPDGIVCCGNLSDGGVFEMGRGESIDTDPKEPEKDVLLKKATMGMHQTDTMYNWAPFLDLAVHTGDAHRADSNRDRPQGRDIFSDALVGTTGREPYGALSCFRYGCEAIVDAQLEVEEEEFSQSQDDQHEDQEAIDGDVGQTKYQAADATRVWGFQTGPWSKAALLSSPTCSMHIKDFENGLESAEPDSDEPADTISAEILAAERLDNADEGGHTEMIALVERHSVRLVNLRHSNCLSEEGLPSQSLQAATVAAISHNGELALVISDKIMRLFAIQAAQHNEPMRIDTAPNVHELSDTAVCANVFSLMSPQDDTMTDDAGPALTNIAAVATTAGCLELFNVDRSGKFHSLSRLDSMAASDVHDRDLCDSLVFVPQRSGSIGSLVCGLRSGRLLTIVLRVEVDSGLLQFGTTGVRSIGNSSLNLASEDGNSRIVIATCDGKAYRVDYSGSSIDPTINRICFTAPEDRSVDFQITAARPFRATSSSGKESSVVALSPAFVLFSRLEAHAKPSPLRLPLPGTPTRVVHSKGHRCFFAASNITYTLQNVRCVISRIVCVPQVRQGYGNPYNPLPKEDFLRPGQKITCLLEWTPERDGKQYPFLVVATADENDDDGTAGSVAYYKIVKREGMVRLEHKRTYEETAPVTAMCQFDNNTLVYCTGTQEVRIKRTTFSAGDQRNRTVELLRRTERGPIQYLAAHPPFISVSPAQGSTVAYHMVGDDLELVASDSQARANLSNLPLPDHRLLLATNKNHHVVGITLPDPHDDDAASNLHGPVFSAELPVSMTRICRANVRPPWKQGSPLQKSERDLLGTAPNGSLWMFTILSRRVWRMLQFVQNMCARDSELSPFAPRRVFESMHIEPDDSEPSDRHVDGDILSRLTDRFDAANKLNEMLRVEPLQMGTTGQAVDFATATQRVARFDELVREVVQHELDATAITLEPNVSSARVCVSIVRAVIESPF